MNLEMLVSEGLVERVGWALLHFVWQGALVAAVLVMALVMLRRHSAAARYVAACAGLLLMALLPVGTFCVTVPPTPAASPPPASQGDLASTATETVSGSAQEHPPQVGEPRAGTEPDVSAPLASTSLGPPRPLQWRVSGFLQPLLPWAVFAWFVGTLVLSVRLSGGWAFAQCLRRVAVCCADERWQNALLRLCGRLRVSRPVQLLESGLAQVPTVVGWLRPVILLPASAVSGLTAAQVEAILAHELAHIRRHDYLINLLQGVAEVLLFYHPAVWWVSNRIRVEREHCCDDVAVAACRDPVLYARALAELEVLRAPSPEPAVAATGGALLHRVRRLVGPPASVTARSNWLAGLVGLLFLATLLIPLLWNGPGLAQEAPTTTMQMLGVELVAEDGVREGYPQAVGAVASSAKAAFDQLFPDLAKPRIRVEVRKSGDYYEGTVTDRQQTIYAYVGAKGVGEFFRSDSGPVGILCQAVVELHNARRLAGFDRYVARRYLAPAVADALGPDILPGAELQPGAADVTGMLTLMADPAYAAVHPDFAAASALVDIDRELGLEALRELVAAVPPEAPEPFAALREATLAREPALEGAFALYDEAMALPIEEDGTCLIASFEADEPVTRTGEPILSALGDLVLVVQNQFEMSQSDEWATDGELSLKLHAERPYTWMGVSIEDPDWKFKDWTRFAKLELDIKVEGNAPIRPAVSVGDDVGRRHGVIYAFGQEFKPGEERHIVYGLSPASLRGQKEPLAHYFDGRVRASEIGVLRVSVREPPGPFTLYIDNIRLTPKASAPPRRVPGPRPAVEEPAADDEAREQAAAEAAALVQEALAHKRAGQLQQAEGCLRKALELQPDSVGAHRVLAWVLVDLGRKEEAAAEFRKVLELTDDDQVRQEARKALERLE